jgi:hypothetical protein
VAITGPSAGSTVGGMVTITATSADNFGVAGLQFQVDGLNIGNEVQTPPSPQSVSWDSTFVASGSHLLTAVVHDAAGNYTSASVTVTVANQQSSQTLFTTHTPAYQDVSNGRPFELGVRVMSDVPGRSPPCDSGKGRCERHAHRTCVDGDRAVARDGDLQQRKRVRLAAAAADDAGLHNGGHGIRGECHDTAQPSVRGDAERLCGDAAGQRASARPAGTTASTEQLDLPSGSYDSSNYFRDLVFIPQ